MLNHTNHSLVVVVVEMVMREIVAAQTNRVTAMGAVLEMDLVMVAHRGPSHNRSRA